MSFAKGTSGKVLNVKSQVSDAQIAGYYLGITKIPTRIKSPLRTDNKPSMGIYSRDGIHIYYVDFATGDKGSIIDLLCQLWHLSYNETWERIANEIGKDRNVNIQKIVQSAKIDIIDKSKTKIQVKVRKWKDYDKEYWESYGVTIDWLKFANVYPISHIIFYKEKKEPVTMAADKLAYAFVEFKEGNITYKIYQPLDQKGFKWLSTHDRSVISLWAKVPEHGEQIVICSSLKDALCFWSNTGIPAISPQGEGYTMSDTAVAELKRRYKNIYILYDSDIPGRKDSEKLSKQTGFKNILLPEFPEGKDISDLYKHLNNPAQFRAQIINLLKN